MIQEYNGTAYLQVRKHTWNQCRVVKSTQHKPTTVEPGCVVVKIKVSIPSTAFDPIEAQVKFEVDDADRTALIEPWSEAADG